MGSRLGLGARGQGQGLAQHLALARDAGMVITVEQRVLCRVLGGPGAVRVVR